MENGEKVNFRPPIVTLMGHVDHGKTTLLDAIRQTNMAVREHGGITQHTGAYQITFQDKAITFIDTPGHEAFEKMRSRGAEVADIVILVVAANEGVKPQTVEAIKHIQKAKRATIVAITKTDLPDINIEKIKKELTTAGVLLEGYGGEVPVVEVAAPKGKGIGELLEVILLVWQLSPQPSGPQAPLEAVVIESSLDPKRGSIVTVIVKKGTLSVGQKIMVGDEIITVRALINDRGENISQTQPGQPVEILGFKKLLEVGSIIGDIPITRVPPSQRPATLAEIIAKSQEARNKFKVILKADVLGTLEAILTNLPPKILVVSSGVGEVNENDIALAKISNAPILVFNTKVGSLVKRQAEREEVIIKNYKLIYELLSDINQVAAGFEQAQQQSQIVGRAKIIASFIVDGKKIAGAKVINGRLKIGDQIILKQSNGRGQEAKIVSLKRFKKDVETVLSGQDCGIGLLPNLDFKEGDIIESLG